MGRVEPREVTVSGRRALSAAWCWVASGCLAMMAALGLFLADPVDRILTWQMTLSPGSIAYSFWDTPIDVLFLRTYVFNVTNEEAFLRGEELLNVEQVGPFTYREVSEFRNLTVHPNNSATFKTHRHLEFVPEMSIGNLEDFRVTVPNVPYLGAATVLEDSTLVTNLALRSLAVFTGAKPLLRQTVEQVLWGYDDPLVSMAHTVAPSFVDFKRLGYLDRIYSEEDNVEVKAGPNSGVDPKASVATGVYSIQKYRGVTGFSYLGHGMEHRTDPITGDPLPSTMPCDTLQGSYEGVLFPRKLQPTQRLFVFRTLLCRAAPIDFVHDGHTEDGFRFMQFQLYMAGLLDPSNRESMCYCSRTIGSDLGCMPPGFTSISPCFYQMPVALSQPHFMDAPQEVQSQITGMLPHRENHTSFIRIQPDTGIPLVIRVRVQLNLMVGRTRLSATKPFNNMALPIIWVDMSMDLPPHLRRLVALAVHVGPALQATLLALMGLAGAAAAAWGLVLRRRLRNGPPPRRHSRSPALPLAQRLLQHHITAAH